MSEYPYSAMVIAVVGIITAFLWAREPSAPEAVSVAGPPGAVWVQPSNAVAPPPAMVAQQYPAVAQGGMPATNTVQPQVMPVPAAPPVQTFPMRAMPPPFPGAHN